MRSTSAKQASKHSARGGDRQAVALPGYDNTQTHYNSTAYDGCLIWDRCITCPREQCVFDDVSPVEAAREWMAEHDCPRPISPVWQLWITGLSQQQIADQLGISKLKVRYTLESILANRSYDRMLRSKK